MKKIFALMIAAVLLCTSLSGCALTDKDDSVNQNYVVTDETNVEETEKEVIRYTYRVSYKNIEFVSYENKEEWRESLLRLISNEGTMHYEGDSYAGYYDFPNPEAPGICFGWQLGLFDIDVDGTPELLVDMGGGSAGNACYYVYDIQSGKNIGSLDGGHEDSWCTYFNTNTGRYESIGQFQWRRGWTGRERLVNKATITNTVDGIDDYLYEATFLFASYSVDAINWEATDEEKEQGWAYRWEDIYTDVSFRINGQSASIDEYFYEYDLFVENYARIPETGLRLIRRLDYSTPEEIVDALLSTEQQFISIKDEK